MRPLILDMDMGTEDCLALLLALKCGELDLLGVSVVSGVTPADAGAQTALRILELVGRVDVPVHVGPDTPLSPPASGVRAPVTRDVAVPGPDPEMLPAGGAADLLVEGINARPGEVTLVCTGPLTNAAVAERRRPGTLRRARRILVAANLEGGGARGMAPPDYNASLDPEAFRTLLTSGANVSLVGTTPVAQLVLPAQDISAASGDTPDPALVLLWQWLGSAATSGEPPALGLREALTVALTVLPGLCDFEPLVTGSAAPVHSGSGPRRRLCAPQAEISTRVDGRRLVGFLRQRLLGRRRAL